MKYNKVKGTEDYYPEEMSVKEQVFGVLRSTAKNFGFNEVESSSMESIELLTAKSGEEIKEQIFTLDKRGKENLGLRFDLTIPITRMFVDRQRSLPKPAKWFGLSRMWRYERPQKGRLREFYQLSAELFGSDKPEAVADCVNLVISCFENLKLTNKDIVVKLNNRKFLEGIVTAVTGSDKFEDIVRVIDKKAKLTPEDFVSELEKTGISNKDATALLSVLETSGTPEEVITKVEKTLKLPTIGLKGAEDLRALLALLPAPWIQLDLSIARGLAYYTGTVFECYDRDGKFRAVAGGGQYDQLTNLLGGQDCPAVGFGLGYSTLKLVLEDKKCLPTPKLAPDYFIASVNSDVRSEVFNIANKLRKNYRVEIDLKDRKLGKQLDFANVLGAKNVIVIGPDEVSSKTVKVRNMQTSKEITLSFEELFKKSQ
jgi:histidyl-tRNA synthetase